MAQNNTLSVTEIDGILVVDSRLIAGRLNIEHRSFIRTLRKFQIKIEQRFGAVRFKNAPREDGNKGGDQPVYALLTEPQATTLMTLSRNTDEVVECKLDLVDAFEKAKAALKQVESTLTAQELRIKDLELQLAVAKANAEASREARQLSEVNHSIATLHGAPMLALIQGRPEAVVEHIVEVKEVVLCTESGKPIVHTKGLTKTAIAKELGLKKADKFVGWLKSMQREDLLIDGYTAVPCQYVPYEKMGELKRLWANHKGDRQRLLGE